MKQILKFQPVALTLLFGLAVSYILCVVAGLLFGWSMYEAWLPLMPGVAWPLSISGFTLGLLWVVVYSLYVAALMVFPFNYLQRNAQS